MIFVRLARREPGGAKGLLESMAAGNTEWYRPLPRKRKRKVNIVLHRSNGKASVRAFRTQIRETVLESRPEWELLMIMIKEGITITINKE
jgi:hypothetical protein